MLLFLLLLYYYYYCLIDNNRWQIVKIIVSFPRKGHKLTNLVTQLNLEIDFLLVPLVTNVTQLQFV